MDDPAPGDVRLLEKSAGGNGPETLVSEAPLADTPAAAEAPTTEAPTIETPATGTPVADTSAIPAAYGDGGDGDGAGLPEPDSRRAAALAQVLVANGENPHEAPPAQRVRHRSRVGLVAAAAVVVVVGIVAGALAATISSNGGQQAHQATSTHARTAPLAPPPPSPVRLVSSDQQGAVYSITSNRVVALATASGRVWMEFINAKGGFGPVLWEGILTGGQSQTVTADGPVWVRIGASSNVVLTVNGARVLLPGSNTTYNVTFSQT